MTEEQRKWINELKRLSDEISSVYTKNEYTKELQKKFDKLMVQRPRD
jgi:hypothetical protein